MEPTSSLFVAAKTWNDANESMESVNARIQDGAPPLAAGPSRGWLRKRFDLFPGVAANAGAVCLEIGSGTG